MLRNFLDWLYLVVYLWPTINKILFIYKKRVGPGTWYLYTNEKYLLGSWWGEQVNSWKVVICSYLILSSPICTAYWFTCAGSQWVLVSISCYEHTKFPLLEIYVLMYKNKNIKIRYQNEVLRYKRCLYVTYCIPCRVAHYVSVLVPCTRANRVPARCLVGNLKPPELPPSVTSTVSFKHLLSQNDKFSNPSAIFDRHEIWKCSYPFSFDADSFNRFDWYEICF